jgi:hypothetical protein
MKIPTSVRRLLGLWFIGLVINTPLPEAAVSHTNLRELVVSSDVIARAIVTKSQQNEDGSGRAWLQCDLVYKGSVDGKSLQLTWGSGPEEAPLRNVGERYLIFLKRYRGDVLEGTHPLASYWPLKTAYRSSREVIPYVFPVTMVDIDTPALLQKVMLSIEELPREKNPVEIESIPLDLLVQELRSILRN